MDNLPFMLIAGFLGLYIFVWVIKQPFIGLAITGASLAIVELLPDIPYLSSALPLVGGITLVGYLFSKRKGAKGATFNFTRIQILGVLFLFWILVSNPRAALLGGERNWAFTLLQLWILLYMAGDILDTPDKQRAVMVIFSIFSILSAFYAIQTGAIGETFDTSVRAEGYVDNVNAAARYFVVAMVFLTYLRSSLESPLIKFASLVGILVTYFGVFYTLSRTGIVLLFAAQGLILFFQAESKQRVGYIVLFLAALVSLWFLSESIFDIMGTFLPTVTKGEDTMGLRYNLWRSAWLMWLDHPIRGVGIGRYIEELGPYIYTLEGPRRWNAVTHNTYLQVLSETGIVGFVLFMSMIWFTFKNFVQKDIQHDSSGMALRNTWLIAFIVMLLGGITKSDHADKFTWMVMGLSVYFARQRQAQEVPDKFDASKKLEIQHSPSLNR